jgi:hypothetical protein
VNCSQAREMIPIYREIKANQTDTIALDVHLTKCADCRTLFDQHSLVGERIRSLPPVEVSSEAHNKLLRALAVEHRRFLQRSSSSAIQTPTPDFLKPYLKEQIHHERRTDALASFSSAETGPLPIVRPVQKRRRHTSMSHLGIVGLAAMFMLVMMVGGIASLLMLARHDQVPTRADNLANNSHKVSRVSAAVLSTQTEYSHVASAVASRQYIYYTAYGDYDTGWMLLRLDNKTRVSTPLLSSPASSPLIVLGSSKNWLAWLQWDLPKTIKAKKAHTEDTVIRNWTLYVLPLTGNQQTLYATPKAILQGSFDQKTVPAWVHTPIQGTWFTQDTLLVSSIDQKGNAHLIQYLLEDTTRQTQGKQTNTHKPAVTELAHTGNGHIFTSPTANSDGTAIYWGEEWLTNDHVLHGNIWTQQTVTTAPRPGKWAPNAGTETTQFLFSADEKAFRPQVVNNTLFLIGTDTSPQSNQSQAQATKTPQATGPLKSTPTATPIIKQGNAPIIPRIDPTVYLPQVDAAIKGKLQAFSVENGQPVSTPYSAEGSISALQGGGRFLIWQDEDNSIEMYDLTANIPVDLTSTFTPGNAAFMSVNGDTAVWLPDPTKQTDQNTPVESVVQFSMFNWPPPAPTNATD